MIFFNFPPIYAKAETFGSQTHVLDLKMPVFGAVGLKIRLGGDLTPETRTKSMDHEN